MRMRRLWLALGFLLVPTLVHADDHRARAFAAMSQSYRSILAGFYGAVDVTVPTLFKTKRVSVLGEFGVAQGEHDDDGLEIDETNTTYLGGLSWIPNPTMDNNSVFSVHVLAGVVHTNRETANDDDDDDTHFGLAFGGAWDFIPSRPAHTNGFGARAQVDWVYGGDAASFLRASIGATYIWYPKSGGNP
jgi:hypothetical protein